MQGKNKTLTFPCEKTQFQSNEISPYAFTEIRSSSRVWVGAGTPSPGLNPATDMTENLALM